MSAKTPRVGRMHSTDSEPVHSWFSLSYSNYLALPRSILQSAPVEWQRRFVACLEELDAMTRGLEDMPGEYRVQAIDGDGKFTRDPFADYERGRRRVPLADVCCTCLFPHEMMEPCPDDR